MVTTAIGVNEHLRRVRAHHVQRSLLFQVDGFTLCQVNAFAVRDLTEANEEFDLYAIHHDLPDLIPDGEIWMDDRLPEEHIYFAANAITRILAHERGLAEDPAYTAAISVERVLRERFTGIHLGQDDEKLVERIRVARYGLIPERRPLTVWNVDGDLVRSLYKTDFGEGGNGYAYDWIPSEELWIEQTLDPAEAPYIVVHEHVETMLMRDYGVKYDKAHQIASRVEYGFRMKGVLKRSDLARMAFPGFYK